MRIACLCAVSALALARAADADYQMNAGSTYLASQLGSNPVFNGGTLELDSTTTISKDFTVNDVSTNEVDIHGSTVTMSGKFTGTGGLTFADTVGGGVVTLTNSGNTYSGTTTVNSGATLALGDTGTLTDSALVDNGTFDVSATTSGGAVLSLSGSGSVVLGNESLALTTAAGTFSGTISGTGGLTITAGTETLTAANTYTGITTISGGTLILKGSGSVANSGSVTANGTFDISQTSGASVVSLSGVGIVQLGANTLTITSASGSFTGVIEGTGGVVLTGGEQYLSGANTFTGGATVTGGILHVGSPTIAYNIADSATFSFYSSNAIAMTGVVSGTGAVTVDGGGAVTISTVQTYTGPTSIANGRLSLSGTGSIASSSSVAVSGTLDISATTAGASIASLSGNGTVQLGTQTLTIANGAGNFAGTISGTGDIVVAAGNQTFSGSGAYTGSTIISGGTLTLQPGSTFADSSFLDNSTLDVSVASTSSVSPYVTIGSLGGSGSVTLGSHTLILANAGDTFSGTISGGGNLTIDGGTETLTGANTYTGATTVSAGKLILSGAGSLAPAGSIEVDGAFDVHAISASSVTLAGLSGTGTVTLGAKNLIVTDSTGVFSGVIGGTGGLTVTGGTLVLSGNNTYTGPTTISGGTLQLGDSGPSGSIAGDVLDKGTLAFSRSDSNIFSGVISGTGAVVQVEGTTILTANNTYSGGTTITSGTLQIGNGAAAGWISGNVVDNGTLAFARSDATTFGGMISGTGSVSALTGTVALTAVEQYTGATAIASGATLKLTGGGSIAASSGVAANGTFDVSAAAAGPQVGSLSGGGSVVLGSNTLTVTNGSGNFSGAISGAGGLVVTGGTQTLSGTNTYTGTTTVSGGGLKVDGSISASHAVVVNSGGTLGGNGTVSAVTVNNGGTLTPGETGAGTLTVQNSVTFNSGSNYVVTVASASSAALHATGAAQLGGTLSIASADGTYLLGQKMTVLTADAGVANTFTLAPDSETIHAGADYASKLTYDAKNVYLEIDLANLAPLLPDGATKNQASVVAGIDTAISAGSALPPAFQNLGNLTSSELAADATQLSGEIGGVLPQIGISAFSTFIDAMSDHLADSRTGAGAPPGRPDVWLNGFGGTYNVLAASAASGAHTLKSNEVGFVAGANWALSPHFTLGGAVSMGRTDFHLAGTIGKGNSTAIQAGLYGLIQYSRHFYGSFAAALTTNSMKTQRVLTVSGTDDLSGKLTGMVYGGRYETGVMLNWLTPYVAVQDAFSSLPGYSEKAPSGSDMFALHYASRSLNTGRFEVGFRQDTAVDFTPRWLLTPDGTLHLTDKLAWAHGFGGDTQTRAAFVSVDSSDFTFVHAAPDKDGGLVSLGAELVFNGGLYLNAHFDGAFSQRAQSYTGFAGVGYTW
ncbi:MAG TPA: autotransporter domain-containing protein [Rhizomicrobium sp.]|nr:autotransporter domain-containing protein [Rhizomicrobium sp.]